MRKYRKIAKVSGFKYLTELIYELTPQFREEFPFGKEWSLEAIKYYLIGCIDDGSAIKYEDLYNYLVHEAIIELGLEWLYNGK